MTAVNPVERLLRWVDGIQQAHSWLGFPFGVVKKFGDDQAGALASLIAYYGFFSLFPLLLVFVEILNFVLQDNPALQQQILDSALAQVPVLGGEIERSIGDIQGSGVALLVGVALALWAGLGVTQSAQNAMNEVWNVPKVRRPNFFLSRARSLLLLVLLGVGITASTALASLGLAIRGAGPLGLGGSLVFNSALFLVLFSVLTARPVHPRQVLPGAVVAGVGWTVLQLIGTYYVSRILQSASEIYGVFATVIGLLSWLALGAQWTLLAAEVNVVLARRLWPRSLTPPPLTEADERALTHLVREAAMRPEQSIAVTYEPDRDLPS